MMDNSQVTARPDLPGAPPTADAAALRDFLARHVSPHIHLMTATPDAKGLPGRWFGDDVDGAVSFAIGQNTAGINCHLTPNPVKPHTHKKPARSDIIAATHAHVDSDPDGTVEWSVGAIADQMRAEGASLVVFSGGGVQGYWTLDEPSTDFPAVEAVNISLRDRFRGGDKCQSVDHAMRLPFTVNWPDAKKRAKGRTPALSRVLYEVDTRHTLDGLRTRFPAKTAASATAFDFSKPLPEHYRFSQMSDADIVADICAAPKLAALWRGDASAHPDRSDADFALACAIIERARTPERAVELFQLSGLDPDKRPADANTKARSYLPKTIHKALERMWQSEPQYLFRDAVFSGSLPPGAYVTPPSSAPVPATTTSAMPQLVSASSFAGRDVPVRRWIVEPLVPEGYVTDLTADGGTGKSLLALQLGVARATGTNWLGMPAKRGATIYLAAEDDRDELHRRLADICRETGTSLDALDDLHILPLFGEDARLAGLAGKDFQPTTLYAHLHTLISRVQADFIIIDTRADTFGGDEVNRAQVMQFVTLLKKIANDHSATVLLVSHPSRAGQSIGDGQSGSTAWGNAVRSRLYLTRENDNTLTLATKKANYGPNDTEIKLEWRRGCFVSLGNMADPFTRVTLQAPIDQEFFNLLVDAHRAGRKIGPNTGHNYAPKVLADASGTPTKKKQFTEAMQRLLNSGRITVGKSSGPPSKQTDILIPVF